MKIFILFVVSFFAAGVGATEASDESPRDELVTAVKEAIEEITFKGIPSFGIGAFPQAKISDVNLRRELSEAIVDASMKYGFNPMLLVAIAYREGSFKPIVVGKIDEQSTFQIVPTNVKWLKSKEPNCNLDDYYGAAYCSAAMLQHGKDGCGNMVGAISYYATGRICRPTGKKIKWLVKDRLKLSAYLSKKHSPLTMPAVKN